MLKYFAALLVVVSLFLLAAGCQTTPSQPSDLGNMMPEGQTTLPLWGWMEMCADPARYEPELCPIREGVEDEPLPTEPKQ